MAITIGRYEFEGPYISTGSLEDRAGVYVILCKGEGDKYSVVDVGESSEVKTRIENHDRTDCWKENCTGTLAYAVLYTPDIPEEGRRLIEQEIRTQYRPPCGER